MGGERVQRVQSNQLTWRFGGSSLRGEPAPARAQLAGVPAGL